LLYPEASDRRDPGTFLYQHHQSEKMLLYRLVLEHYPVFRQQLTEERLVASSCGARRMAESSALLVDEVFPHQPVRQWVLSFPSQRKIGC